MSKIHCRRAVLAGIAAAPALAAPALALTARTCPDAELIELVEQAIVLDREFLHAEEISERLFGEYVKRCPERPQELRWRVGDPVGYAPPDPSQPRASWCHEGEIEELRRKGIDRSQWWQGDPKRRRARAHQIIAAQDRYQAELARLKTEIGLDEAEARREEAFCRYDEAADRAMAMRATTIEGLRAKARLVLLCCWNGEIDDDDDRSTDNRIMVSMVRDLVAPGAVS